MENIPQPKCENCGRFISLVADTRIAFTPDNEFGPEKTKYLCPKCATKATR